MICVPNRKKAVASGSCHVECAGLAMTVKPPGGVFPFLCFSYCILASSVYEVPWPWMQQGWRIYSTLKESDVFISLGGCRASHTEVRWHWSEGRLFVLTEPVALFLCGLACAAVSPREHVLWSLVCFQHQHVISAVTRQNMRQGKDLSGRISHGGRWQAGIGQG